MEYKSIDFVGFFSLIMSALSVLGLVALTFGPWAQPSVQTARTMLILSSLAFSMIGTIARNVTALLEAQADQIATLQRQLADQRPEA
jgi:hypothetical protein